MWKKFESTDKILYFYNFKPKFHIYVDRNSFNF